MTRKLRWGVLGAARIALQKVIPAIQRSRWGEVAALASRDAAKAAAHAAALGIPKSYGSYEEMLGDPALDAIYNPLPNHLHLRYSLLSAAAGKHVLCEKPLGLSADQARELLWARGRHGVLIAEAFMVRCHPQWEWVEEQTRGGRIGAVRAIQGFFSYTNTDPANIRNQPGRGGGGLMDIGCYPVHLSRFVFAREPSRALALAELDPSFGTDRLTSAILDFGGGHATFTCATQTSACQRMTIVGAQGRLEMEIPFNPPPDCAVRAFFDPGTPLTGEQRVRMEFGPCDQYALQADRFALAAWGERKFPIDLEDSVANMETLDALARSIQSGEWERPGPAG